MLSSASSAFTARPVGLLAHRTRALRQPAPIAQADAGCRSNASYGDRALAAAAASCSAAQSSTPALRLPGRARHGDRFIAQASSGAVSTPLPGPASAGEAPAEQGPDIKWLLSKATLAALFLVWYAGNIGFNIYNKQLLKVVPLPVLVSTLYMGVGGVLGWISWKTGLVKQPKFTREQLVACIPLALFHAFTNTLMLTSLSKVAVSLSHTIRATEPLFVTAAAAIVLGTRPSKSLVASMIPIVVGVSMASATDISFAWVGFFAAMGSNLASTMRNVYSKQVMSGMRGNIDSVSLLTVVNAFAFLMLLPLLAIWEGPTLAAVGSQYYPHIGLALFCAVLLQLYQQVSYNILSKVTAVTHSVANCLKRVVVIVSAVVFFQHPVSMPNAIGTSVALAGVFLFSQVKIRDAERKKKADAAAALAAGMA